MNLDELRLFVGKILDQHKEGLVLKEEAVAKLIELHGQFFGTCHHNK